MCIFLLSDWLNFGLSRIFSSAFYGLGCFSNLVLFIWFTTFLILFMAPFSSVLGFNCFLELFVICSVRDKVSFGHCFVGVFGMGEYLILRFF